MLPFFLFGGGPTYWIVLLLTLAITGGAAMHVRSTYRRWAGVRNSSGMTGAQMARHLLDSVGLQHVGVDIIDGELTDNYDPRDKTLHLSQGTAYNASVAAECIAAHEIGHAIQDAKLFAPMRVRSAIVPAANLGSQSAPLIIIAGVVLMGMRALTLGFEIAVIGLLLFGAVLLFHVVTLPVEVDASRRAMQLLRQNGVLAGEEIKSARSVLNAAALTYLAAIAASALQILYWASLVFGSRRN